MKTYCFIGSDKNAGKTTALNFIYNKMCDENSSSSICLTSIGMNGEETDQYEGCVKPPVRLRKNGFFVTHSDHLKMHTGKYATCGSFTSPQYSRNYILAKCLTSFPVTLEGPNHGQEVVEMKKKLPELLPQVSALLIDGSVDRQFLASPAISDMFYFSVLFSGRKQQLRKTQGFLYSLSIPQCAGSVKSWIEREKRETTRSLLFSETGETLYHGETIPFSDRHLQKMCTVMRDTICTLYVQGALTKTFHQFLAPMNRLSIILDNFTLYLNVSAQPGKKRKFGPDLYLLNPVQVKTLFIKQESDYDIGLLPENVPVVNLFR